MPDIFTRKKRSEVMSRIRGARNKDTELRLIQIFRANRITGWRRGASLTIGSWRSGLASGARSAKSKILDPGPKTQPARSTGRVRPDFVFPELKVAVFVDGCFWHGCPKHVTWPKTRAAFWRKKILGNKARDRRVNRALRKRGWKVVRVWQHELKKRDEAKLVRKLWRVLATQGSTGRLGTAAPTLAGSN